jgi:hypothetical protein
MPLSSASNVVDVVEEGLRRIRQPAPSLQVPATYAAWIQNGPFDRVGESTDVFETPINVAVPDTVKPGIYRFPIHVVQPHAAGADTIGATWITARVGWVSLPWRLPILLALAAGVLVSVLSPWQRLAAPAVLHEWPGSFMGLLARLGALVVVVLVALAVWEFAPGTVPPAPEPLPAAEAPERVDP